MTLLIASSTEDQETSPGPSAKWRRPRPGRGGRLPAAEDMFPFHLLAPEPPGLWAEAATHSAPVTRLVSQPWSFFIGPIESVVTCAGRSLLSGAPRGPLAASLARDSPTSGLRVKTGTWGRTAALSSVQSLQRVPDPLVDGSDPYCVSCWGSLTPSLAMLPVGGLVGVSCAFCRWPSVREGAWRRTRLGIPSPWGRPSQGVRQRSVLPPT